MRNSHTHVVYGYSGSPTGDPDVMGFGKSDILALRQARANAAGRALTFYFIRSNGSKVPAYSAIRGDGREVIVSVPE